MLVPDVTNVKPPKSKVPEVIVKLVTPDEPSNTGLMPAFTIVMLSAAPGTPLGVQLVAFDHADDTEPFHVYEIAKELPVLNASNKKNR